MKRIAIALCVLLAASAPIAAERWDARLPAILDAMVANYYLPEVQTVFGTFTYAYSSLPTPFARWFQESVKTAIGGKTRVKLLDRDAAAAMDPIFAKQYGDFFSTAEAGALLYGNYFDEGDYVRVRLELTGFADRVLIGSSELRIPRAEVPQKIAVEPSKAIIKAADDLGTLLPSTSPGGLSVSVRTERYSDPNSPQAAAGRGSAGAVYRDGEEIVIFITSNKDAYAKIYSINAAGQVILIWPNDRSGPGRLKGGVVTRVPSETERRPGGFQFQMTPPFGT